MGYLVQQSVARVDRVRIDLAGDTDNRRGASVGRGQTGASVEQPWAGHNHAHADVASGTRVAVGHVRRGLLMADVQDSNAVTRVIQRIKGEIELHAWQGKQRVHAFADKRANEGLAARHSVGLSEAQRGRSPL